MPKPSDPIKQQHMFSEDMKFLQKTVVFHPTENKFLALKRSPTSHAHPNDWDLVGGNVLFGQLHEDALRREVREETSLEVGEVIPTQIVTKFENNIYFLYINYRTKALSDNIVLSHEHTKY